MTKRIVTASVLAAAASWGQEAYEQGAKVFKLSCAQGYCHGSGGTQGRAPKLLGRNYDAASIRKTIENGVPGTGMPAFKDRLDGAQLTSVLFYVVKISGGETAKIDLAASTSGGPKGIPAAAAKGKAAFFDAQKGVNRCSTCHALEDVGVAVGPNLSSLTGIATAAIRAGRDGSIRRVTTGAGDVFPGLMAEQKGDWVKVYDLTVAPPVLRTLAKGEAKFAAGAGWRHSEGTRSYTDEELGWVSVYLAWIAEK